MRILGGWTVCLTVWLVGLAGTGVAMEYYVAPTGSSDSNNGSIGSPFATFGKAIGLANPGDTIYARGGTYAINTRIEFKSSDSGTAANPINLWAYQDETPVLDFSSMTATLGSSSGRGIQFNDNASWWNLKGLTIQNAKDNGIYVEGNNNVFDRLSLRWNADSGLQLDGDASGNLVVNSDSYENYDPQNRGENADGFAAKFRPLGAGNVFRGDRAWRNSDDGWDFWVAASGVTVEDSWAFDNGYDPEPVAGTFRGDGNGVKLGHDSGTHLITNVLVWDNPAWGIDVNGNALDIEAPDFPIAHGVEVYNVTSVGNGSGNFLFDEDFPHVMRNNISYLGTADVNGPVDDLFNTFNGISVDASDFLSLDDTIARGPRQADGSLPVSDFLRLEPNSNLIDAGVDIGLPFNGSAPDLGAYETTVPAPALPGDYNNDLVVNAADYTVWRNNLNTIAELPNDETPGSVDDDDYGVWKSHFGQSLPGGGSLASSPVPEPGTAAAALLAAAFMAGICRRKPSAGRVAMHGRG